MSPVCGGCNWIGGAEEIRTPDLRYAKAALSQLSYGPFGYLSMPWWHVQANSCRAAQDGGGPFWTRTRDLSLIRTAL
jgi:hypothetical protein